ncbi:hypothetical protein FOMPIDRAFT_1047297 [Fomitopsis schrenkii]|uniref:Peregrin n=1 Tax=Fomitopsis schrenkii TaxID=2126942 RepID=S8FNS8_FOMSC|nr:hypothetical protein FOMPIDRAFT_1047297 [Fomitopsis schrenkii]
MGRGVSPGPSPLPKVSFSKVQDDFASYPSGVHDQQMRSFGYNDFSEFKRPVHYIRYIEPLESELAEQVEYDMDEQDQEWLNTVNAERKKENQGAVSYELFEIIMDRLEKEWFDLTKNNPKPDLALPSEDSTCAICDDSEGENTNAIVFCDGCNLAVHQDCYGVPYIPEGQWLCRKCTVSPENPVSCVLCPNEGGAFKQTVHGDWVHLLCAIWVPETRVANDVFMEPITGIDKISKQRWRLKCSLCEVKEGACIQCNKPSCFVAFHVTCARKEKLLMPMKASQGSEAPMLAAFCEKHLPQEQQDARVAALEVERAEAEMYDSTNPSPKSNKTARAYAKTYKPGPPLVPRIILERILQYIGKVAVRHKREFVALVCRFWSLKREARRGAAFLKRLHLEPWTANVGSLQHTDEEKVIKLECMKRLRRDLESIRMVAEMCRKRESMKLDRVEAIQYVFDKLLLAHEPVLRHAFERISAADRMEIFREPVSLQEVPDYLDIVERPMCWRVIDEKLSGHQYLDLQDFKDDIKLVATNAMLYNRPGTSYHKTAQRVLGAAEPIMAELDRLITCPPANAADEACDQDAMDEDDDGPPPSPPRPPIGDLEPPVEFLDLLLSEDAIKDDINFILDKPPLDALFSYELAKEKPPPPEPEPKPPRVKFDRKVVLARKRWERLNASPGFRDRRSLRSSASLARSEGEAPEPPAEEPQEEPQPEAGPSTQANEPDPSQEEATETPIKVKRKKHVIAEPGKLPAEMVEEVDNQQSFKMFNKGWILPPDQVRGGRQRPASQPTPTKKKGRGARGKSHLVEVASTPAENETLGASGEVIAPAPAQSSEIPAEQAPPSEVPPGEEAAVQPTAPEESAPEDNRPGPSSDNGDAERASPHAEMLPDADMSIQEPLPEAVPMVHESSPQVPLEPEALSTPQRDSTPPIGPPLGEQSSQPPPETPADVPPPHEEEEHTISDVENMLRETQSMEEVSRELEPVEEQEYQYQAVDEEKADIEPLEVKQSAIQRPGNETIGAEPAGEDRAGPEPLRDASAEAEPMDQEPAVEPPKEETGMAQEGAEASDTSVHIAEPTSHATHDDHAEPAPSAEGAAEVAAPSEEPMEVDDVAPPEDHPTECRHTEGQHTEGEPAGDNPIEKQPEDQSIENQAMEEQPAEDQVTEHQPAEAVAGQAPTAVAEEEEESDDEPPRIIIIEHLDTPATRREKYLQRRLEKQRKEAEAEAAERAAKGQTGDDAKSDLSDLSDLSDAGAHAGEEAKEVEEEPGAVILGEGEHLEGGTLDTFPWWPAVVFEADDVAIPKRIVDWSIRMEEDADGPLHIVRFFDSKNTWQCLELERMRMLGENHELDQDMLANVSRMQKWKSPKMRQQCRDAFRRAMAERETDDDENPGTATPATDGNEGA